MSFILATLVLNWQFYYNYYYYAFLTATVKILYFYLMTQQSQTVQPYIVQSQSLTYIIYFRIWWRSQSFSKLNTYRTEFGEILLNPRRRHLEYLQLV